jgi:hypothetical protein
LLSPYPPPSAFPTLLWFQFPPETSSRASRNCFRDISIRFRNKRVFLRGAKSQGVRSQHSTLSNLGLHSLFQNLLSHLCQMLRPDPFLQRPGFHLYAFISFLPEWSDISLYIRFEVIAADFSLGRSASGHFDMGLRFTTSPHTTLPELGEAHEIYPGSRIKPAAYSHLSQRLVFHRPPSRLL